MDNLLFTDYKPDGNNNVMTLKFVINDLGINASTTIPLDKFYEEIVGGEDALKKLVLNSLITSLQAKLPVEKDNTDKDQTTQTETTEVTE